MGETLATGWTPAPVRLTVWGLLLALSATVTVAVMLPVVVGLNVTLMVQLLPAASEAPQLLVWENSLVELTLEIKSAALPTSCTTTVCGGLVLPTAWGAKVKDAGVKLTPGALLGLIFATHTSLAPPA